MTASKPDPQQPPGAQPRQPTTEERTRTWVEERLVALGFNPHQAYELAEHGVDWHAARTLLERGCDHDTAVDLLT